MTTVQHHLIQRDYDRKQLDNYDTFQTRVNGLYLRIPEIKSIKDRMISNKIASKKADILGNTLLSRQLSEEYTALEGSWHDLLAFHNIPYDFFEQAYTCPDCKDTGYIDNKPCHCFKQSITKLLYKQSNMQNALKHENFSTFSYDSFSKELIPAQGISPYDNMVSIVKSCKDFISHFDDAYTNLLFFGHTGVGKTFLSNCIAKELIEQSKTVIYLTAYELFELFQKHIFDKPSLTKLSENVLSYIFDCDLLIIDDLGTEMANSFTTPQLFTCINERHLLKKSTIISTNLSLKDLYAIYSERIVSRLLLYKMLKFIGPDIRQQKAYFT